MYKTIITSLALCTALFFSSTAEAFVMPTGAVTPILKWHSIQLEHFEIIYPQGSEAHAQRIAHSLNQVYQPLQFEGKQVRRTPIVLSAETAETNGYAMVGPIHSNFFIAPLPEPDISIGFEITTNFTDLLAVHEYRHIVQFENTKYGLTRLGFILFGTPSIAADVLFRPGWYSEGDATFIETAYTNAGRGRYPTFDLSLKTMLAEREIPNYDTTLYSSFKYPIPSVYQFGYHYMTSAREEYGPDIWEQVNKNKSQKLFFTTFGLSFKKYTQSTLPNFHKDTMNKRAEQWQEQRDQTKMTDAEDVVLPPKEGFYQMLYSPQPMADGSILTYREGPSVPREIVQFSANGEEKKRIQTGFRQTLKIHMEKDIIVWDEHREDPLRDTRSSNVIRVYDGSKEVRTLKKKERHFSPSLSPDAGKIAAVQHTKNNNPALVIIDTNSEQELWRFDFPATEWIRTPTWTLDGEALVYAHIHDSTGISIELINIEDKSIRTLVEASHVPKVNPSCSSSFVFYSTPKSGIDAIWAISLEDGRSYRVASRPFGAYDPKPSKDEQYVYFTDAHYLGTGIQRVPLDPSQWDAEEDVTPYIVDTITKSAEQIDAYPIAFESPTTPYASKRYRRLLHPRNTTARWQLFTLGLEEPKATVVLSDPSLLSWMQATAGLTRERQPMGEILYINRALPVSLTLGVAHISRANSTSVDVEGEGIAQGLNFSIPSLSETWMERSWSTVGNLPIFYRNGPWTTNIDVSLGFSHVNISNIKRNAALDDESESEDLIAGSRNELKWSASYISSLDSPKSALKSRWMYSLKYSSSTTPFGGNLQGTYNAAQVGINTPGAFDLDGLSFVAAWQNVQGDYTPYAEVFTPNIYTLTTNDTVVTGGADYAFPIAYPDNGIDPLIFVKRITGGIFYEAAHTLQAGQTNHYTGLDLLFDIQLLRLPFPFSVGPTIGVSLDTMMPYVFMNFGTSP